MSTIHSAVKCKRSELSDDRQEVVCNGCPAVIVQPVYNRQACDLSGTESDFSSTDFSKLCDSDSDYEVDESTYESYDKNCKACETKCHSCDDCKSCDCRSCYDYSIASVLRGLDYSQVTKDNSEVNSFYNSIYDPKENIPMVTINKNYCEPDRIPLVSLEPTNTCEDKTSGTPSITKKGKKFTVTIGSKVGHQWSRYNPNESSYHINGKNGPVLHLYRGQTYFFDIQQEDSEHSFVLTNKPDGGEGSLLIANSFAPTSNGVVSFNVDESTPRFFFYQSINERYMGGLVIVHEE